MSLAWKKWMMVDNVECVQKCKQADEEVFMDKSSKVEGNADMDTMNDTWEDEDDAMEEVGES